MAIIKMFFFKAMCIATCLSMFLVALLSMGLLQTTAHAQTQQAHTATVPLDLVGPIQQEMVIGGGSQSMAVMNLNIDQIHRVMLNPGDMLDATLQMQLSVSNFEQLDVVAQGKETNGTTIDLTKLDALQHLSLNEEQSLAIMVWRHAWHWWGGGELTGFSIRPADQPNAAPATIPDMTNGPQQQNDFGQFKLMAMSKRDKFPLVVKWVDLEPGDKPGQYRYAESGKLMSITYKDNQLNYATNGRAKFTAGYDWAPTLIIEPFKAGVYALSGNLKINCGDPKNKANVTWAVVRIDKPGDPNAMKKLSINCYRALRPILNDQPAMVTSQLVAGKDYDATPVISLPYDLNKKTVKFEGLAQYLKPWVDGQWENHGIILTLVSDHGSPPALKIERKKIQSDITVVSYPKHKIYTYPVKTQPDVYVQAQGNKLMYGNQRLRLWGVAGGVGLNTDPERLNRIGFNAIRLWPKGGKQNKDPYYPREDGIKGVLPDSAMLDQYDRYVAAVKAQGMFIMCPFLMCSIPTGYIVDDNSFVAGGDDWQQWKQAVQIKDKVKAKSLWPTFDDRLFKSQKQHLFNLLNHVNPHTGKRYAEEESIAVWELDNEAKIVKAALENGFDTWPDYFYNKLNQRWCQWLKVRYNTTEALAKAWGKLGSNESLEKLAIELAPTFTQRNQYPKQRGDDFVHFIIDLVSNYYKQLEDYARQQAPKGVGVNVQPFSYDTQYRPNTPWQFAVTEHADVANFGMYFFALNSTLADPPSMYVMDSHTMADKPTVIYETNSGRPGRYRVEHAYRTATLASWQDWDAVFWHYYHSRGWTDEHYLTTSLPYQSTRFYWSAVEFEKDPVMISTIGLAGQIFLNQQIAPAPNPVDYEVGKKASSAMTTGTASPPIVPPLIAGPASPTNPMPTST